MSKYWYLIVVALIGLSGLLGVLFLGHSEEEKPLSSKDIILKEAEILMSPLQPVETFPTIPVAEAGDRFHAEELVIGVTIDGESRAYPLNVIDSPDRNVINDRLGNEPILVVWCDLCHTAAVFSRRIQNQTLRFGSTGMLWRGVQVMYDTQTESFWNHLLAKALSGEFEGTLLKPISSTVSTWKEWKEAHPAGTVLIGERVTEVLNADYYVKELKQGQFVLGINDGHPEAWRLDLLAGKRLIETDWNGQPVVILYLPEAALGRMYSRTVDGTVLSFQLVDGDLEAAATGQRWNVLSGQSLNGKSSSLEPLPAVLCFTVAWQSFFPESTIHVPREDAVPDRR